MQKDEERNYEIFRILDSINLSLDKQSLAKQISELKACMKYYSVNSLSRKQLKRNIASLTSIYTAIDRVPEDILQKDLDQVNKELKTLFEDFKLVTGVSSSILEKTNIKKKKVLNSLEDLVVLTDKKSDVEDDIEDLKNSYNLLEKYLRDIKKALKPEPDYICQNMSLLINGTTPNFQKLPRLGIIITKTPYGIFWSNQYVIAVKKDVVLDLEKIMSENYKEKMVHLYKSAMLYPDFPNYNFYWLIPERILMELDFLQVSGYALPFPNHRKDSNDIKNKTQELRKLRLEKEATKKAKMNV